ncbi:MAG: outer membrane beta-barrel protein [Gallionellaceae bacterium]
MNKKLLSLALLSTFSLPAFAAEDSGLYLVGMAGNTSNISNVDSGTSLGGMVGFKFNSFLAVEGGMVMLADKANYQVAQTPVIIGGTSYTYTSTTMAGSEFAAVVGLPLGDDFSILLRLGYTSLERSNNPSPAEVEVQWKGSTMGLAAQYMLPYDFAIGQNKMSIGFRAGVTRYNLSDATGALTETPTNSYVAGVIQF